MMKTTNRHFLLLVLVLPLLFTQCSILQQISIGTDNTEVPRARGGDLSQTTTQPTFTNSLYTNLLPTNTTNNIVTHQFYTVSYSGLHRQSEWVAYELTAERLQSDGVNRKDRFKADPKIFRDNATPADYSKTGYDRGHLAPAADMLFLEDAMLESFYMSNMSPQKPGFNRGVWKRLEAQTRDWALEHKELVVVTGPILTLEDEPFKVLTNGLVVPHYYYKVLLDNTGDEPVAICFILKNESSKAELKSFVSTIDELEARTGLDFFAQLPDEIEDKLESTKDLASWGLAPSDQIAVQVSEDEILEDYLPTTTTDQVVEHSSYTFSYKEEYEQSEWVAYELSKNSLTAEQVKRKDRFKKDPAVLTGSATPADYSKSGYDRGHLAPAADMSFSEKTMLESFYMSNMSPQKPGFNRGIWKKLEVQVRLWAKENDHLYIVTGPILVEDEPFDTMPSGIPVPNYYYKVLLDLRQPEVKAIAFVLPNASSKMALGSFATTIDDVELRTGLDFFSALDDDIENKLEGEIDLKAWGLEANMSR